MTDIQFYHLLTTPLERALPKLMEKALGAGMRSLILVDSEAMAKQLGDALWQHDAMFLPHGCSGDPYSDRQPIYITHREENPNSADVLVVTDGSMIDDSSDFKKVLDVFDGHSQDDVTSARKRWKQYMQSGVNISYIKQQPGGGWKQEAAQTA